jgi:phosphoenolpyruvate phosphomutase
MSETLPSPTTSRPHFRDLLDRPGVVRIVGAHNALGARLAERAGFDGVWASGLEVSASHGVPDADILTMSELLDVSAAMAAAVHVPVVSDCDAGYGNVPQVMSMVRRYEAAGIAAVTIEDKVFPKVNSFAQAHQELASVSAFCAKISAAVGARTRGLVVVARTETLIAGRSVTEALDRCHAYEDAGADAVLIHAKDKNPDAVLEFLERWDSSLPVVVVPTTYHTITADELAAAGAQVVIYANHGLRALVTAVSETFSEILRDGRTTAIEDRIATIDDVFELQGLRRMLESARHHDTVGLEVSRASDLESSRS